MSRDLADMRETLIDFGIATNEEICLVEAINGVNEDTYNDILYVRTGYHDLDSYFYDEAEKYEDAREEEDAKRGCADCPDDECTGHCMSCSYRPV